MHCTKWCGVGYGSSLDDEALGTQAHLVSFDEVLALVLAVDDHAGVSGLARVRAAAADLLARLAQELCGGV